ncbi:MAG TPA: LPS export ABC transporter ATP-binding protein [bacterium]|nr:LPS export ABC transporter ATP-binding protein [Candidatus Omnitrophota bacterium]HOJ59997.1 LPS export ABC transporter ATP-binding protein [bacterium]HOL93746.1 LPS export ABC transporter ATP-binding protein [bacterium]HPP01267.1 LPS export ABC transporter ATP-binding protein [bacterium]
MAVLRAHNLVKRYGQKTVVNDVSLSVSSSEIVGLLGPNGAGKTTTFGMIMGIVRPDQGTIGLDGIDITHRPLSRRARMGIGYLSQEPSIFRNLTVEQNIMVVLENMPMTAEERKTTCQNLLEESELARLCGRKAETLSGGEKRRLEICRALAARPRILLLDEPFSGVDPIAVGELQEIILQMKKRKIGVLITDHSVRETLEVTDRAYIMHQGVILTQGSALQLIDDPIVRETYLGENFYFQKTR